MIVYLILYGLICSNMVQKDRVCDLIIVSLLFRGSVVQRSRGSKFSRVSKVSKFPKFRWLNAEYMLVSWNLSLPEVMFVGSRRFLLINTVNVGQFESVSSRDTGRDGSY